MEEEFLMPIIHGVVQSNVASIILFFRRKQFNSGEIHVVFILVGGADFTHSQQNLLPCISC